MWEYKDGGGFARTHCVTKPRMCKYWAGSGLNLCLLVCRIRSDEDGLGASSRSPSLTFPTMPSLPQPETPHATPLSPLAASGEAPFFCKGKALACYHLHLESQHVLMAWHDST